MQIHDLVRRFIRDDKGVAAIEFAIVAIPVFLLLLGAMEYGLIAYTEMSIEAALTEVARDATLKSTDKNLCGENKNLAIFKEIRDRIRHLPNYSDSSVDITSAVVEKSGSSPTVKPDMCLDKPNDPFPATCSTYQENNGTPGYQPPSTTSCLGANGDVVEIRVVYPWKIMIPMLGRFFTPSNQVAAAPGNPKSGVYLIQSTIVLKNEP